MDYLKQFLEELSKNGIYYAEMVETCAEIYIVGDTTPAVLLELQQDVYHINFRCDIPARLVAQLMYDMTIIDEDIIIGPEFMISQESGVVYGQNAQALFYMTVHGAMESAQMKQEAGLDGVMYVVEQPIYGYGNKNDNNKNRMQRLWENNME